MISIQESIRTAFGGTLVYLGLVRWAAIRLAVQCRKSSENGTHHCFYKVFWLLVCRSSLPGVETLFAFKPRSRGDTATNNTTITITGTSNICFLIVLDAWLGWLCWGSSSPLSAAVLACKQLVGQIQTDVAKSDSFLIYKELLH